MKNFLANFLNTMMILALLSMIPLMVILPRFLDQSFELSQINFYFISFSLFIICLAFSLISSLISYRK